MIRDEKQYHPHYSGLYFSDYEFTAAKTATYKDVDYLPLGLGEETGELLHEFARAKRRGVALDQQKVIDEVGDVLWVLSQICRENKFSLETAARANMEKLTGRSHTGTIHDKRRR
jgi:NTP pyrophosphatase (non-canonical NTP hydrolase)